MNVLQLSGNLNSMDSQGKYGEIKKCVKIPKYVEYNNNILQSTSEKEMEAYRRFISVFDVLFLNAF